MASINFHSGNLDPKEGKFTDVIVIDIGFSKRNSSCGVASRSGLSCKNSAKDLNFGGAVNKIYSLIREGGKFALVVEAPLSVRFSNWSEGPNEGSAPGVPVMRRFEKKEGTRINSNGWYYGAGATVLLGAVSLLKHIASRKCNSNVNIHLYEVFSSNKVGRDDGCESHTHEAIGILKQFERNPKFETQFAGAISIVSYFGILKDADESPPPVMEFNSSAFFKDGCEECEAAKSEEKRKNNERDGDIQGKARIGDASGASLRRRARGHARGSRS